MHLLYNPIHWIQKNSHKVSPDFHFQQVKTPINCEVQPKNIHHAPKPKRNSSNINFGLNGQELLSTPSSDTSLFFPNLSSLTAETGNAQQESRDQHESTEQTSFSPVMGTSLLHQSNDEAATFFSTLPHEIKRLKANGTSLKTSLNAEENSETK